MKSQFAKQITALFAVFFFVFTNLLPPGFAQIHPSFPERIPTLRPDFNLPQELGQIEEHYSPSAVSSAPFVIHLQTAHGDPHTQRKVKEILSFLYDSTGARLVFAEGAAERLNPELLRFFPDSASNQKMADLLLERGLYTGIDLFLLDVMAGKAKKSPEVMGIENARLYRAAYRAFKKVLTSTSASNSALREIELEVDRRASKVLSKGPFALVKEWQKFQENRLGFLAAFNFIEERAKKDLKIDLQDPFSQLEWPQLMRLARLREVERGLDLKKLESERTSDVFKILRSCRTQGRIRDGLAGDGPIFGENPSAV